MHCQSLSEKYYLLPHRTGLSGIQLTIWFAARFPAWAGQRRERMACSKIWSPALPTPMLCGGEAHLQSVRFLAQTLGNPGF